jgi:hypothetical protein
VRKLSSTEVVPEADSNCTLGGRIINPLFLKRLLYNARILYHIMCGLLLIRGISQVLRVNNQIRPGRSHWYTILLNDGCSLAFV